MGSERNAGVVTSIAERAAALSAQHVRKATTTGYDTDWRQWLEFCAAEQVDPLVADADALVVFAGWLGGAYPGGRTLAPASINRRVTGVLAGWRRHDIPCPVRVSARARAWVADERLRRIRADEPIGRGQAPAVSVAALGAMSAACPGSPAGARDRAIVLLGFAIGARRAELSGLDLRDIRSERDGLRVHVRISKSGTRDPLVKRTANERTCPVRAWLAWAVQLPDIDGPAFRRIDRHGNIGGRLSPKSVGAVVTRKATEAKIPDRLTGHSLRAGFATEARRAKRPVKKIADQAGWAEGSSAIYRYFRDVEEWEDNVLDGMGL